MTNSLAAAWAEDRTTFGAWVTTRSEAAVEVLGRSGYDYVGIDCQHSLLTESDAGYLLQPLLAAGVPAVVRVSRNDPALIGRLADAGADAVIVPLVDTAEQAAAAVAACRYPPRGVRSFGPIRASMGLDPVALEERISCFVMVESVAALDNLDAICATPGLAGVYVGPGDLSISMGTSWLLRPRPEAVTSAIARVPPACRRAGIVPGMHAGNGALAAELAAIGFRLVTLTSEVGLLGGAAARDLALARGTQESAS
jgi:2-keto-3-deoxy-L-rhamnonate aldolase RhmA